jgi:hypothetical protein
MHIARICAETGVANGGVPLDSLGAHLRQAVRLVDKCGVVRKWLAQLLLEIAVGFEAGLLREEALTSSAAGTLALRGPSGKRRRKDADVRRAAADAMQSKRIRSMRAAARAQPAFLRVRSELVLFNRVLGGLPQEHLPREVVDHMLEWCATAQGWFAESAPAAASAAGGGAPRRRPAEQQSPPPSTAPARESHRFFVSLLQPGFPPARPASAPTRLPSSSLSSSSAAAAGPPWRPREEAPTA